MRFPSAIIKDFRTAEHLDPQQAAAALKLHYEFLNSLERGAYDDHRNTQAISNALERSVNRFLFPEDTPNR